MPTKVGLIRALLIGGLAIGGLVIGACAGSPEQAQAPVSAPAAPTPTPLPAPAPTPPPTTTAAEAPSATSLPTATPTVAATPISYPTGVVPVRLEIPSIGVDAPTVELDLSGPAPDVPTDFADTGWYRQTRLPGEIGPAVIAGHVDSRTGPAVFVDLAALSPGDEVIVHGADGDQRSFRVTHSGQYPKDALGPEVFGFGEAVPELRLITCSGTFDSAAGHYVDNLVVYARLTNG